MQPSDLSTDELLRMYRHAKGLISIIEALLMERKAIICPKCGIRHKHQERHVFGNVSYLAETSS